MANIRRMPKRFLDGAPADVADIFDHPAWADRYTVFYRKINDWHGHQWVFYRGMSERPTHPQGIGLSGEMTLVQFSGYRSLERRRRIAWRDLPAEVQACVRADCGEVDNDQG